MTPLDLRIRPPRATREPILRFFLLARTILSSSAWVWILDAFRAVVASASNEDAKLETFVVDRMSPEDQVLVRDRHPVIATRSDLSKILDILDAEDAHAHGVA